jgi:hypothetical protein
MNLFGSIGDSHFEGHPSISPYWHRSWVLWNVNFMERKFYFESVPSSAMMKIHLTG